MVVDRAEARWQTGNPRRATELFDRGSAKAGTLAGGSDITRLRMRSAMLTQAGHYRRIRGNLKRTRQRAEGRGRFVPFRRPPLSIFS